MRRTRIAFIAAGTLLVLIAGTVVALHKMTTAHPSASTTRQTIASTPPAASPGSSPSPTAPSPSPTPTAASSTSSKTGTGTKNPSPSPQSPTPTPTATPTPAPAPAPASPIALVYKDDTGAAGCDGCAEAVATLLENDPVYHFDVRYVGPNESLSVQTGLALPGVVLYAQPGDDGSVDQAYAEIKSDVPALQQFVANGGHFLGFCLGAYLEGTGPGLNLLSDVGGDTDEYTTSPGATVTKDINTTIQVSWRGATRTLFFEDGNYFTFGKGNKGATILATYTNGEAAAVVGAYGKGKVGGVGPHPEADQSWYSAYSLQYPGSTADLGYDLIETTMQ